MVSRYDFDYFIFCDDSSLFNRFITNTVLVSIFILVAFIMRIAVIWPNEITAYCAI